MKKSEKTEEIRTRFAPSPTGFLHVGGLRNALYSYLFAKQHSGKFILRIEDTDIKRRVESAINAIHNDLKWAGLQYDEGPDIGGPYGPYIQSQRLSIYRKYAEELIINKRAYYCFCSEKTLEKMREKQIAEKHMPKYDRRCCNLSRDEVDEKIKRSEPHVIRMRIPDNRIVEVDDLVRGQVFFNTNELDDQVLLKSDGYPTYHLAVVVDDNLMKISHVLRSEEWLPSTPKHVLLYEFFNWRKPQWGHFPLLLNQDKTKISKRKGDIAVEDYISNGYLPEALINFIAFLGWNPDTDKEIYSMKELLSDFSIDKVHKAGAIFNIEKLDWLNGYYLRKMSADELTKKIIPFLEKKNLIENKNYDFEYIKKVVTLEQPRLKKFSEIGERAAYFFKSPDYKREILIWKNMLFADAADCLNRSFKVLFEINDFDWNRGNIEKFLLKEIERVKDKDRGRLLWPLRTALTGLEKSPGPFEILEILGKKESLRRIRVAIKKLT